MMEPVDIPPFVCPTCGYKQDCATQVFGTGTGRPEPGDYCLCMGCGEILRFGEGNYLRKAAAEDLEALPTKEATDLIRIQRGLRHFNAQQKRLN